MADIPEGTVDSEQVTVTVVRTRRTWQQSREWRNFGTGKGESGRDFDYVDAILPTSEETTVFKQVLDGAFDVNALIRAIVDVTTQKDPR